jgi:pyrroline-5-carboxylate reductase
VSEGTVGFLGCGAMGQALLDGWLRAGRLVAGRVWVSDPVSGPALAERFGVNVGTAAQVAGAVDVLILAVKPKHVAGLLQGVSLRPEQLVVSIVAGLSRARLRTLCAPARVVRTMPNVSARVGRGVTLVHQSDEDPAGAAYAVELFGAVGHAEPLVDESTFHAGTALSGSGPAYLFVAMQAMADGAVAAGLPRGVARRLAAFTVLGAGALAAEPDAHPEALKDSVASPGGTTIAALGVLEQRAFRGALFDAVRSAAERSKAMETSS